MRAVGSGQVLDRLLVVGPPCAALGLLGLAQVTRWTAPRLTLVAVPLMLWGMWGFHNILAMGYIVGTAGPSIIGVDTAVAFNDGLVSDPGAIVLALLGLATLKLR